MQVAYISRDVLGEPLDIAVDLDRGSYRAIDGIPSDSLYTSRTGGSLDQLAALSGLGLRKDPPAALKKQFELLGVDTVCWRHALTQRDFKAFIGSLIEDIRALASTDVRTYHHDVFRITQACLGSLSRAAIDVPTLRNFIDKETNPSVRSTLLSFVPADDHLAARPTYDQLATVTGRLTISSGPRILTLAKDKKSIIRSRFEGGSIVSIDYSSIEPKVALAALGGEVPDDVYAHISGLSEGLLDRKQAKIVTISLLYGASEKVISRLTGLSDASLDRAVDCVRSYLRIDDLFQSLLSSVKETGCIKNAYGRRVVVSDRRKLINYYAQSTAVDVALLGFSRVLSEIEREGLRSRPIFVIHDSLMLDVHPDERQYIAKLMYACEAVPGFSIRFNVKCEELGLV